MAGILLDLVPKRTFDFGTLTVPTTETLAVVERIDISQYIEGLLVVRVHSANVPGGTISFSVIGDGYTDDDPSLAYVFVPSLLGSVTIDAGVGAGQMRSSFNSTMRGHYATLRVSANRSLAAALNAQVSISLALKCPDD